MKVQRAYHVGALAHAGQIRRSGEAYITHPIAVAGILAELRHGRRNPVRGDPARRAGRHAVAAQRDFRGVRRSGGRTGRWRHQAGQDPVPRPPGSGRGKLPQDDAGDVARPARDPDQAGRPPAQHAHARRDGAGVAPAHRPGDAGDLRADRPAPGHEPDQGRAAGHGLPGHVSASAQGDRQAHRQPAGDAARGDGARSRRRSRSAWRRKACRSGWSAGSRRPGASTTKMLREEQKLRPGDGRVRLSRGRATS